MPVTLNDDQVATIKAELEQAKRDRAIRESAEAIWNDPELSDQAKALWKKKFPETQIQDYDLKQEVFSRLDREKAERDKAAAEAHEAERLSFFQKQKSQVQSRYGMTDDAMERMEKEMNDKKVYDYEVMATHFVAKEPKPIEHAGRSHLWNHDRQKEFKEIADDPEQYAFNEIVTALNNDENRRQNR